MRVMFSPLIDMAYGFFTIVWNTILVKILIFNHGDDKNF